MEQQTGSKLEKEYIKDKYSHLAYLESACNSGDLGSIPGPGRFPGEGNGNPLQYSCLENPMDGEAWWATVHGVAKESDTTEQLHFHFHFIDYQIL